MAVNIRKLVPLERHLNVLDVERWCRMQKCSLTLFLHTKAVWLWQNSCWPKSFPIYARMFHFQFATLRLVEDKERKEKSLTSKTHGSAYDSLLTSRSLSFCGKFAWSSVKPIGIHERRPADLCDLLGLLAWGRLGERVGGALIKIISQLTRLSTRVPVSTFWNRGSFFVVASQRRKVGQSEMVH